MKMQLTLLLAAVATLSTAAPSPPQMVSDLQALFSQGSEVVLVTGALPAGFTQRWAITRPPTYAVAVKPRLVTDVQKFVQYAAANNVSFLTTGGGHGYTASLGRVQQGVSLDLGNFNQISVDTVTNTMTTGGAVRGADVVTAVAAAGRELPVGQCTCIGYTGATLGGGIGPYSGLWGTQADSLVSAQMVTGQGNIVSVSATQLPELFWGLKGAGHNLGVVTSLTYNVYPPTNGGWAMNADMMFRGAQNGSIWALARSFLGTQPKELSITLAVTYNATLGDIVMIASFIYAGPQSAGTQLIQPFLNLNPFNLNITMVTWGDLPRVAVYGLPFAGCRATSSLYVPQAMNLYEVNTPLLISVVNMMKARYTADPVMRPMFLVWTQHSQVGFARFPDSSAAFAHRDAPIFLQINGFATVPSQIEIVNGFGKDLRNRLQQSSTRTDLALYVNFAYGDEPITGLYGARKLPRLQALKATYDPNKLFSYYNPIV